jgi:hypothetical protein
VLLRHRHPACLPPASASLTALSVARPARRYTWPGHPHPIGYIQTPQGTWRCDVCGVHQQPSIAVRYHCTAGCDWDVCGPCCGNTNPMAMVMAQAQYPVGYPSAVPYAEQPPQYANMAVPQYASGYPIALGQVVNQGQGQQIPTASYA